MKNFKEDCEKYIKECEKQGMTFQEDVKRSMIQGAISADRFSNPNYYAYMRLRALRALLQEIKNKY